MNWIKGLFIPPDTPRVQHKPPPATRSASSETDRLTLFNAWIEHESELEGFVCFDSSNQIMVQISCADSEVTAIEVLNTAENGVAIGLPSELVERLDIAGYTPLEGEFKNIMHQDIYDVEPLNIAATVEATFREIYPEDEVFVVTVDSFD